MHKKINTPPQKELEDQYNLEGTTISSLAKRYNVTQPTMRKWLISYNITRKDHQQASIEANNRHKAAVMPTRDILFKMRSENTIKELEAFYSVSQQTIYEWLNVLAIPIK